MNQRSVGEKGGLLRKGSHTKMVLKEKIVQIYEAFFRVTTVLLLDIIIHSTVTWYIYISAVVVEYYSFNSRNAGIYNCGVNCEQACIQSAYKNY